MNIESIWMIIVAIAAPITGVVAFYVQLKHAKKVNLENEKLHLDIHLLKEERDRLKSQIRIATDAEIEKYSQSSRPFLPSRSSHAPDKKSVFQRLTEFEWVTLSIAWFIVIFIGYFFYDVYRLGLWLINQL